MAVGGVVYRSPCIDWLFGGVREKADAFASPLFGRINVKTFINGRWEHYWLQGQENIQSWDSNGFPNSIIRSTV